MMRWTATTSMIFVLLSAGIAQSQSATSGQSSPGVARVTPRRPLPARSSMTAPPLGVVQVPGFAHHPGSVNHPGLVRHPSFARSSGFARPGRFPFWRGFATNRIFFVQGGVLAPWPYWYNYPWPSYAPSLYWAYCQSPEGYFPYVQDCPGGWVPVVPAPPAPESWEGAPDGDPSPTDATSTDDIREQLARSRAESTDRLDVSLETPVCFPD